MGKIENLSAVSGRHVLNNENAKLVAEVIIPQWLNLYMLTHHIVAAFFQRKNIMLHRFFGRRRKKPVRPPSLVKSSDYEVRLIVEEKPKDAIFIFALRELAHCEITTDDIIAAFSLEIIKVRFLGAPEAECLRHLN